MTAIVGLVEDGTVTIGGDSAGVAGYSLTVRADQKVFRNGPMVFGFTSSFRMGQILRYSLVIPLRNPEMDVMEWAATVFVDAVRSVLREKGFARKTDGEEKGGHFLIGYEGRLFKIENDFQVGESVDEFAATGCGEDVALGALYALSGSELSPKVKVKTALLAAERMSAAVRGPFTILEDQR